MCRWIFRTLSWQPLDCLHWTLLLWLSSQYTEIRIWVRFRVQTHTLSILVRDNSNPHIYREKQYGKRWSEQNRKTCWMPKWNDQNQREPLPPPRVESGRKSEWQCLAIYQRSKKTESQIQIQIRSVILPFSDVKVSKSITIRQVIYFTVSSCIFFPFRCFFPSSVIQCRLLLPLCHRHCKFLSMPTYFRVNRLDLAWLPHAENRFSCCKHVQSFVARVKLA